MRSSTLFLFAAAIAAVVVADRMPVNAQALTTPGDDLSDPQINSSSYDALDQSEEFEGSVETDETRVDEERFEGKLDTNKMNVDKDNLTETFHLHSDKFSDTSYEESAPLGDFDDDEMEKVEEDDGEEDETSDNVGLDHRRW